MRPGGALNLAGVRPERLYVESEHEAQPLPSLTVCRDRC